MYNTEVVCTYHSSDVFLETDKISEKDKQFVRNCLYKQEFLNIFNLEEFNDTLINKKINDLYEKIKECKELIYIIGKMLEKYYYTLELNLYEDDENYIKLGLMTLFSYEYLHLSHSCISEFLKNNKIEQKTIEIFEAFIMNN
jgi:hypothetical protein